MFTDETSITDDRDVFQSGTYDVDDENKKAPSMTGLFEFGAGNETRTRDPNLGKVVLYQLSYSRSWRPVGGSNPCCRRERAES